MTHRSVVLLMDESPHHYEDPNIVRRAERESQRLADRGWRLIYVTLRRDLSLHSTHGDVPHYSLQSPRYGDLMHAIRRFAACVKESKPDIVHATGAFPALVSGMGSSLTPPTVRVFQRSHTVGSPRLTIGSWLAARLNDFTLVSSVAAANCARTIDRTSDSRIFVIREGIDPLRDVSATECSDLRSALGIPLQSPVVGMVGRMRPEKGHRTLLDAMPLLAAGLESVPHLILVGSGPQASALATIASRTDAFVTHFVGHQDDVASWYALSDVIVIPSYREAFGLVAVEAMASGSPIVASRVGGLPEVLGDAALFIPARDPVGLAESILRVLRNSDIRQGLRESARRRFLDGFSLTSRTEAIIGMYEEALRLSSLGDQTQ